MSVENSKGECNLGQHEINFHYGEALAGRRRPRDLQERRQGDRRPGGPCRSPSWRSSTSSRATHATSTARSPTRAAATPSPTTASCSSTSSPGQLAGLRELTPASTRPHVNSYKRFAEGSFAPTAVAWGNDNRTCSMRVVGHGEGAAGREPAARRGRQPLPRAGGDDRRRACTGSTPSCRSSRRSEGNAYTSDKPHVPRNLYDARDLFAAVRAGARGVRRRRWSTTT